MQSVGTALAAGRLESVRKLVPPVLQPTKYVGLCCPTCGTNLTAMTYHALGQSHEAIECHNCSAVLSQERGIWLALAKNRFEHFERFIHDYEIVRKAEKRGSGDPAFYLSLPSVNRTDPNAWQWAIRARTYNYIQRKILPVITSNRSHPMTVLDLGAGNGWLSHRLAGLGHRPVAVDLQTNELDGLGAAVHYSHTLPMLFPRFQAELDRLPFADQQFDCAIFNASFHYSENYDRTLAEAIRCLRRGGTIVIADTPSYSCDESGRRMVAERREIFKKRFGFASDALASGEFLTKDRLLALEFKHHLEWTTHEVWYGFRWACRPLIARLKRRREPSQFRIYTAQVKTR
jgi:ubiquinone/menaquinone biosynthesis C-methylase UbiE